MGKIYVGQNYKIELTTNEDITEAQSVKIKYKTPDGTIGEWTATIVTPATGVIKYDVLAANNTATGTFTVWPKIIDANGLTLIGEPSEYTVYNEGS